MNAVTMEKTVIRTRSGQTLTIAQGTEATATYGEILSFWQGVWGETEKLRPDSSVVEDFLIGKRVEVERENEEYNA